MSSVAPSRASSRACFRPLVEQPHADAQAEIGVEGDASFQVAHSHRRVIDAEEQRIRVGQRRAGPAGVGYVREFERMAVRIAELVCGHRPSAWRQELAGHRE